MKKFILNNSLNLSFIILCGYFNCHMAGVKTDKSSKILGDIFRQLEITDLSKEKHSKLEETHGVMLIIFLRVVLTTYYKVNQLY